jgi:hypothetical protein
LLKEEKEDMVMINLIWKKERVVLEILNEVVMEKQDSFMFQIIYHKIMFIMIMSLEEEVILEMVRKVEKVAGIGKEIQV